MCLNKFNNFIQVNIDNMDDELAVTLTLIINEGIRNKKLKTRKSKRKRSVWVKSWLSNRIKTSAYQNIFTGCTMKKNSESKDKNRNPSINYTELYSTSIHKNNETNDKFYRKVAFLMYTEMVRFTLRN